MAVVAVYEVAHSDGQVQEARRRVRLAVDQDDLYDLFDQETGIRCSSLPGFVWFVTVEEEN